MTSYIFEDDRALSLWDRASPGGQNHWNAFSWRESPGGVDRAWNKIVKKMTDQQKDDLLANCFTSAEIQARDRKRRSDGGERLPRPVGLAVWLNDGRWGNEVESASEKPKQAQDACGGSKDRPNCKDEAVAQDRKGNKVCAACYPETKGMFPLMREQYRKMGLAGNTVEQNISVFKECAKRLTPGRKQKTADNQPEPLLRDRFPIGVLCKTCGRMMEPHCIKDATKKGMIDGRNYVVECNGYTAL